MSNTVCSGVPVTAAPASPENPSWRECGDALNAILDKNLVLAKALRGTALLERMRAMLSIQRKGGHGAAVSRG